MVVNQLNLYRPRGTYNFHPYYYIARGNDALWSVLWNSDLFKWEIRIADPRPPNAEYRVSWLELLVNTGIAKGRFV